jgi:hypothetical protein
MDVRSTVDLPNGGTMTVGLDNGTMSAHYTGPVSRAVALMIIRENSAKAPTDLVEG